MPDTKLKDISYELTQELQLLWDLDMHPSVKLLYPLTNHRTEICSGV